ncbi:MAG: hypothetical protein AMXMBFR72_32930 [Betaproteobacteria bacterium]
MCVSRTSTRAGRSGYAAAEARNSTFACNPSALSRNAAARAKARGRVGRVSVVEVIAPRRSGEWRSRREAGPQCTLRSRAGSVNVRGRCV